VNIALYGLLIACRLPQRVCVQVAVVKAAGRPEQAVWRSTLQAAEAEIDEPDLSPCVVIIGRVSSI
jgi:siroheme synthase